MAITERNRIDFDHHSPDFVKNWQAIAEDFHKRGFPLGWSEKFGGFWVLGDFQAVRDGLVDWETFTSDNDPQGQRRGGKGVTIPPAPYSLVLNESDPPIHTERRRVELPFFQPKKLREWEKVAHDFIMGSIREAKAKGQFDFVKDIIVPTTARTTLTIVGFDLADWEDTALAAHASVYIRPDQPGYPIEALTRLRAIFREMLADRRKNPRDDLVTALATREVNGRTLTDDEGEAMMSALVFGGFDTTTSAAAHALIWLDQHREHHARLIEDPAFLSNAIDEFLRLSSPAQGIGRTALKAVELGGQRIEAGEQVYFWFGAANRDPKKFEDPARVWLERPNAKEHLAFSYGAHRCLGSPLAKIELQMMLKTILTELPDYRIDHTGIEKFPSIKSTNGLLSVPATA